MLIAFYVVYRVQSGSIPLEPVTAYAWLAELSLEAIAMWGTIAAALLRAKFRAGRGAN